MTNYVKKIQLYAPAEGVGGFWKEGVGCKLFRGGGRVFVDEEGAISTRLKSGASRRTLPNDLILGNNRFPGLFCKHHVVVEDSLSEPY